MDSCEKHRHERAVALCGRCGAGWCAHCLIYAFGPKKPPLCMSCAMFAGGVRTAGARPALPKRQLKALQKVSRAEAKAAARTDKAAGETKTDTDIETDTDTEREPASATTSFTAASDLSPTTSDWETPWWEDRPLTLAD